MLRDPSKSTHWVPKPGNPNFLVEVDLPVEKEKDGSTKKKIDTFQQTNFVSIEKKILRLLKKSLAPFYRFIDMVSAESGNNKLLQNDLPLIVDSDNIEDFVDANIHLRESFIFALVDKVKSFSYIGANPLYAPENLPRWVWCQIDTPVFQFLLNSATFGALTLAANELKFPLKALIMSDDVNYMFAQFVAKKFISPKSNAYPSGISNGQMQYRVSSGFSTTQMSNSKWLMGCKEWFKAAYMIKNPIGEPGAMELQCALTNYSNLEKTRKKIMSDIHDLWARDNFNRVFDEQLARSQLSDAFLQYDAILRDMKEAKKKLADLRCYDEFIIKRNPP